MVLDFLELFTCTCSRHPIISLWGAFAALGAVALERPVPSRCRVLGVGADQTPPVPPSCSEATASPPYDLVLPPNQPQHL